MKTEKQLLNELLPLAWDTMGIANLITAAAYYLNDGCKDVDDDVFGRIRAAKNNAVILIEGLQHVLEEYDGELEGYDGDES